MYYTVFFSKGALSFMSTLNHLLQKLSAFHINAGILLLIYFLAINLISFQTMRLDKKKARRGEWRTPESVLFLQAIIGGSVGSILAMNLFHHKTRKAAFRIGMPVILLVQLLLILMLVLFSSEIIFL